MPIVWNSLGISPIQTNPTEIKSSDKLAIFPHPKPVRKKSPFQNPRLPPPHLRTAAISNSAVAAAAAPASPPMAASESQSDPHRREPGQRRPMCGVCTKPLRVCLCGRLRGPPLDTTVGVTVLQHTMEAQHPLSSVRVARLGLRNLAVARVTDVNYRASFLLTTLDGAAASNLGGGRTDLAEAHAENHDGPSGHVHIGIQDGDGLRPCEGKRLNHAISSGSEKMGINPWYHLGEQNADIAIPGLHAHQGLDNGEMSNGVSSLDREAGRAECNCNGDECFRFDKMKRYEHAANGEVQHNSETGMPNKVNGDLPHPSVQNTSEFHMPAICNCKSVCNGNAEVGGAIEQGWTVENMDRCSIAYTEKELRIDIERSAKPKIRWLSRGPLGQRAVSSGFTVAKIQKKKSKLTGEVSEFEEFSITIPPHSALLFPCQRAISIDASDCQVKHLIVLDGTWAKAQRMYHENPWLQLLPHVKLETDRVSLYSEVRHEPKAGCLSTIESIVVAMKKLGEDEKGLDDVLDVFESMIIDQRRCKDENWKPKLKS